MGKINQKQIDNAKPDKAGGKVQRLTDGNGLTLLVRPDGKRIWWFRYRFDGKAKTLTIGQYPTVTLASANAKAAEARTLLADGIDPSAKRKADIQKKRNDADNLFKHAALEWCGKQDKWAASTTRKNLSILENHVFPAIGALPITKVGHDEMLAMLQRIEKTGAIETAHRARELCGRIFRYGRGNKLCTHDPVADTIGALKSVSTQHRAALTLDELPAFLLALGDPLARIEPLTRLALNLLILTFTRPGELRQAEWAEINFERREWRIPAAKMKMRAEHVVPLSAQALAILEALHPFSAHLRYLFPKVGNPTEPMSENTLNFSIQKRLGFSATAHGMRATASTILNEQGWNADVIERQLAHKERNKVRAAYHRSEYLAERGKMMQAWADFLDGLKAGAKVIPLHNKAA